MKYITASNYFHLGSNSENSTTLVIRTVMKEPVRRDELISAAEQAVRRFPWFAVRLCEGENGLEYRENDSPLPVFPLEKGKQYHLGSEETNGYLFRISYGGNAIVLSQHHMVTDGKGMSEFLKTLLYYYLKETGITADPEGMVRLNEIPHDAEAEQEMAAEKYCDLSIPEAVPGVPEGLYPFALPETYWDEAGNFECRRYVFACPSAEVKAAAEKSGTTVSAWLLAVLERAYEKTYAIEENRTIIAALTADKRPAFQTYTMFNFSGYMILAVPPQLRSAPFAIEAQQIKAQIEANKTKDAWLRQTNTRVRQTEKFRKMPVSELFDSKERKSRDKAGTRQALSIMLTNVGMARFPKDMLAHMESVDLDIPSFESTVNYAVLTVGDRMTIGMTMCFDHPALAESIRNTLAELGVSCTLEDCGKEKYDVLNSDAVQNA